MPRFRMWCAGAIEDSGTALPRHTRFGGRLLPGAPARLGHAKNRGKKDAKYFPNHKKLGPFRFNTVKHNVLTFRSRAKVRRQKRQNARLEPRRRQKAARFNPQGFGVRLTRLGAHCHHVLQLRPRQRGTETQSR